MACASVGWRAAVAALLLVATASGARADDPAPVPPPTPAPVPPPAPAPAPVPEPLPAPRPPERRIIECEAPHRYAAEPCAPCAPLPAPCDPCDEPRRGPMEWRDDFVLAHARLQLAPASPDTLGCGRTSVHVGFSWSNSFGWRQDVSGENPSVRYFLVDGETQTLDVTAMHGVGRDVDVGVRIPFKWRGGGVLDDIIDVFHESTSFVTLDNKRKDFKTDAYRVNGLLDSGAPFDADGEKGGGLGDVEAIAKWRVHDGGRDGASFSFLGRVTAPTGTGPFDVGGVNAGLQLLFAQRLGRAFDVFAGAGETWYGESRYDGIEYETWRTHAFLAFEWRPARTWSLILESDVATALIKDIQRYDNEQWYLNVGAKIDIFKDTVLELGFSENLISQQTTSDFGVQFGIEHRW